ncbi:vascular cell adhesion protein 1-like isoform X2 [Stigmatopora argus]
MLGLVCVIFSGALVCLAGALRVDVSPARAHFELGRRGQLSCSVDECPVPPTIRWTPPDDRPLRGRVQTLDRVSLLTLDPVKREHEGPLVCQVACGDQRKNAKTSVGVYAFPSDPAVAGGDDPAREGEETTLTCTVRDVYPAEMLTLDWLRGGRVLSGVVGEAGARFLRANYSWAPRREESGQNLTCRATLRLPGLAPERGVRESRVQIGVAAPPTNTTLSLLPAQEVVEGRHVTFTCRSEGKPSPRLTLSRDGTELASSDSAPSLSHSLVARRRDSARYRCDAANAFGSQHAERHVAVAAHPLRVEVSPQVAPASVSSQVLLTCTSSGCPTSAALAWTRTEPEGGVPVTDAVRVAASESRLLLRDLRARDRGRYECRATCDNVTRTDGATVHVYSLPSDPIVEAEDGVAVPAGREIRIRCDVRDVFPAERLRLSWSSGNVSLLVRTFSPSPSPRNVSAVLRHLARAGREPLSCEARLLTEAGVVWRSRKSSLLLEVHYPPRSTSVSASPAREVAEGQRVTLTCRSDAAPPPTLVLRREGAELRRSAAVSSLSYSLTARLRDSAHYLCNASNELGSQEVTSRIVVTAPPRNTTVLVLPSRKVRAGQNVTVRCRSLGFPPPEVVLTRASDGTELPSAAADDDGVVFRLVGVSARDSGLYRVNASNALGYQLRNFRLSVAEPGAETPPPAVLVAAVVGALALVGAALLLSEWLRRSKKKGFYQLAPSAPTAPEHHAMSASAT